MYNVTESVLPESPAKLTKWVNEPTLQQLKADLTEANSAHSTHVGKVNVWLDNLNISGSAKLPKKKNRSNAQPKLIRKQAEWRYPSLSSPFLSTNDIFNVAPKTFEDKKAAEQNQLILNYQFNTQIDKVKFINEYVRVCNDEGTVVCRVGWDYRTREVEREKPVYATRPNTTQEFGQQLAQAMQIAQQDPEQFSQMPYEIQASVQATVQNRSPIEVYLSGYETVTEEKVVANHPTVEVCDFTQVIIDPTCNGDMSKAKFVIFEFDTSIHDLEAQGDRYKNLEHINVENASILGTSDNSVDNDSFNFAQHKRKKFKAYEYWGFWDVNDDSKVKPFVATWVGDVMIRMEENPFPDEELPFVVVPFLPKKKSLYGEPDGELIVENQDTIGAIKRGMIDILAANANGQRGVRKDILDTTNRRRYERGDDYEFNPIADPRQAFYTHTFSEIPQSAQFMIQSESLDAESLTGVKAFSQGITGNALGDSVGNGRGVLDAASKRESDILIRLADGITKIGRKFISMNSEFLDDEEIFRITNDEFIAVKRDELAGEFDLTLSISTPEEDNAKAQELAFMLQTNGPNSDPNEVKMIRAEIARLRKMPDLAKRIEEYQPQPDPVAQERAVLENELLKLELQEKQAKIQEILAGAQLDAAKAANVSSDTDQKNLDFVEQESGVKQERDLQKQGEQAKANAKLEIVKKGLETQQQVDPFQE